MRVRLRVPIAGIAHGVSLSAFIPDVIYDVDPEVGNHLVMRGAEEITDSESTGLGPVNDDSSLTEDQLTGGVTVIQSVGHDRPRRRQRRGER